MGNHALRCMEIDGWLHILMAAVLKGDFKHFLEYVNIMLDVSEGRLQQVRSHTLSHSSPTFIHTFTHCMQLIKPLFDNQSFIRASSASTHCTICQHITHTHTHTAINTQLFNVSWSAQCVHTFIQRYAS